MRTTQLSLRGHDYYRRKARRPAEIGYRNSTEAENHPKGAGGQDNEAGGGCEILQPRGRREGGEEG